MILPTKLYIVNNTINIGVSKFNIEELYENKFFDECNKEQISNNNDLIDSNELSIEPKFFIFHKSRCGSTLVTNMLKQDKQLIVFCEPNIINECLSLTIDTELKLQILIKIITMFCNECNKYNKQLMLKLDKNKFQKENQLRTEQILLVASKESKKIYFF